jgi:hypothetical protein
MTIVGVVVALLPSMYNPFSILLGILFLISVNYAIPLTKKDNLSIIACGVLLGLIIPRVISLWFFKM